MRFPNILAASAAAVLFVVFSAPADAASSRRDASSSVVKKKKAKVVKRASVAVSPSRAAKSRQLASEAAVEAATPSTTRDGMPNVKSSAVLVQDQTSGEVLFERNSDAVVPIASITKLMTAMVVLDASPNLAETLTVSEDDVDTLKGTRSRLVVGTSLTREDMLKLALMSSENRAASSLGRHYPGGMTAFLQAMNRKAQELGLSDTRFFDNTGLNPHNVSSARDLARMVAASARYPLIREFSTTKDGYFEVAGRTQRYVNTNALVSNPEWQIGLQKTGFTNEAGKCLVMQAWLNQKPVVIVLLDSWGKLTRIGDANRIRRWVEQLASRNLARGPG